MMTRDATTLLKDALQLPERERFELAARLLAQDSLCDEDLTVSFGQVEPAPGGHDLAGPLSRRDHPR